MSYQVLARKWRPKDFASLVGQEHVVRALRHALETKRLHHAYLFTGTRGVGKTTLARILAKCLNCETGVTPEPCGKCSACVEIDAGRFVDLLEVDAATNTRVDEMRQPLEIAHGAGRVSLANVSEMLGAIDRGHLLTLIDAVAAGDAQGAVKIADEMQARSLSFDSALAELAALLLKLALAQSVPSALEEEPERTRLADLASRIDPESLQLYYQ